MLISPVKAFYSLTRPFERIIFCSIINIINSRITDSGSELLNFIFAGIGDPSLFSLLGSRMAINLKEAGDSESKGQPTNHWELHPRNTLSEPQFAAPAGLPFGVFL